MCIRDRDSFGSLPFRSDILAQSAINAGRCSIYMEREGKVMYQTFRFQRVVLLGAAIGTAGLVFAAPQCCARALQQGLALCGGPLLVSLFPFLIVSALLMRCGAGQVLGFVFRPVARLIGVHSLSLIHIWACCLRWPWRFRSLKARWSFRAFCPA